MLYDATKEEIKERIRTNINVVVKKNSKQHKTNFWTRQMKKLKLTHLQGS